MNASLISSYRAARRELSMIHLIRPMDQFDELGISVLHGSTYGSQVLNGLARLPHWEVDQTSVLSLDLNTCQEAHVLTVSK